MQRYYPSSSIIPNRKYNIWKADENEVSRTDSVYMWERCCHQEYAHTKYDSAQEFDMKNGRLPIEYLYVCAIKTEIFWIEGSCFVSFPSLYFIFLFDFIHQLVLEFSTLWMYQKKTSWTVSYSSSVQYIS